MFGLPPCAARSILCSEWQVSALVGQLGGQLLAWTRASWRWQLDLGGDDAQLAGVEQLGEVRLQVSRRAAQRTRSRLR